MAMKLAVVLAGVGLAAGCSNILISKGASVDGGAQIAYAADDGTVFGHLRHFPAGKHAPGEMLKVWDWDTGVYIGEIPQAPVTYNVVGNMNEHGLIIGETTFGGLPSLGSQDGALIDYGSLIWITLQRAKTAQEAIRLMHNLTSTYGYYSTGETFSIADRSEVWIMDFIGKGQGEKGAVWVARKVPDGYVTSHANQARIRTWDQTDVNNNMWSQDVISFARRKGLYSGSDKDFSFSDTYDPVSFTGARLGEARAWSFLQAVSEDRSFGARYLDYVQGYNLTNRMPLFVKPRAKLAVNDTMWHMRTHFDGTWFDESNDVGAGAFHARYRQRPLMWEYEGKHYVNERTIAVQQTGWNFVAHSRSSMPPEVGSVIWFAVDDTSTSAHFPAYANARAVPTTWTEGKATASQFVLRNAFWIFNVVANFCYFRWEPVFPYVQARIKQVEEDFMKKLATADATIQQQLASGQREQALTTLTDFTVTAGDNLVDEWVVFWGDLFVRFRDGFITTQPPPKKPEDHPTVDCAEPGFDDAWKKRITTEAGSKYLVHDGTGKPLQPTAYDVHKLKSIR